MIPVDQTKFSENGERGNCLRACVASVFDLDIDEIPAFEEMLGRGAWQKALVEFAEGLGSDVVRGDAGLVPDEYYIIVGSAPTGTKHACVGREGKVVHDPHPNRLGLSTTEYVIYFTGL